MATSHWNHKLCFCLKIRAGFPQAVQEDMGSLCVPPIHSCLTKEDEHGRRQCDFFRGIPTPRTFKAYLPMGCGSVLLGSLWMKLKQGPTSLSAFPYGSDLMRKRAESLVYPGLHQRFSGTGRLVGTGLGNVVLWLQLCCSGSET